jgi:hypothetical protein
MHQRVDTIKKRVTAPESHGLKMAGGGRPR